MKGKFGMCNQINFSAILSIKVMRDGDGDGKCQEEDGKWVPCPPGVSDGSVVDRLGRSIGKIQLGETIGTKPTAPAPWGAPEGDRIKKPTPRALRRSKPSKPSKPQTSSRLDPNRDRLNFPAGYSHKLYTGRLLDQADFTDVTLRAANRGIGIRGTELPDRGNFPNFSSWRDATVQWSRDNYQRYVAEFNARKKADDPYGATESNISMPDLTSLGQYDNNPRWMGGSFFLDAKMSFGDWWNEAAPAARRWANDQIIEDDYANYEDYNSALTVLSRQAAYSAYKNYKNKYDNLDKKLFGDKIEPVGLPEFTEIMGLQGKTPQERIGNYRRYTDEFDRRKIYNKQLEEMREYLDEDGNVKPEKLDEYVTALRNTANERAQKIEQNAKNQLQLENRRAARNIDLSDYMQDEDQMLEDAQERWAENNPEPQREDYETDEDWDDALEDWNNRSDAEPYQDAQNQQRYLENEWTDNAKQMFSHTFTGLDGKTYRSTVNRAGFDPYSRQLIFKGTFYDENDNPVGFFERTIELETSEVHHDHLKVYDEAQKAGIASTFNALNEQIYGILGIEYITVNGTSSNSGYKGATHWPRNGFTWNDDYDKETFLRVIQNAIDNAPDSAFTNPIERRILQELHDAAEDYNTNITPNDLLQWPGAERWFQNHNIAINYRRDLY